MYYLLSISSVSFFISSFVLLRRVHENRIIGIPGDHSSDVYWPFNVIFGYFYRKIKMVFVTINNFLAPHFVKLVGNFATKLYRFTSVASGYFLQLSNLVHGKGSLKKNTGQTSLFIRDISEYKKALNGK
ncbi:MAG: hypothetical protein WCO84_03365 [bacterium]